MELSQRVQSISAQSAFQNPAGSEQQYPTGHQTAFGYYGRYYPGMAAAATAWPLVSDLSRLAASRSARLCR